MYQRVIFGFQLYQHDAAPANPDQLKIKQTMVSSTDGKILKLAEGIIGRDAAEALKQQVLEALVR